MKLTQFHNDIAKLLKLALPIILSQLCISGINAVNVIMAGHLGSRELAAIAIGSTIWVVPLVFFIGMFMAISPIVAHRIGEKCSHEKIGTFLQGALIVALVIGILWTIGISWLSRFIIDLVHFDSITSAFAVKFLHVIAWSAIPYCFYFVLRYGADGMGYTQPALVAGFVALLVNALFDWLLIYGRWGLPALGIVGCAWSTVFAVSAMLVIYVWIYQKTTILRQLRMFQWTFWRINNDLWEIFKLGLPIAMILSAEIGMYVLATLMMSHFGEVPVAAHQIAVNFVAICFMIPMGLGFAITISVGQAAGAGQYQRAYFLGKLGMALGLLFGIVSAVVMLVFSKNIVAIYTHATDVEATAVVFLQFAALFQMFDCLQVTANGAFRGLKDTRIPMVIIIVAYWLVGMPVAYIMSVWAGFGPGGIWCGLTAGLAVAAVGLSLRFLLKYRLGNLMPNAITKNEQQAA